MNKHADKLIDVKHADENAKKVSDELEKGDIPALIIAAFAALWPALLIVAGVLIIVWRVFAG